MSNPVALPTRLRLPVHRRVLPLSVVAVARIMTTLKPRQITMLLRAARRGARPATAVQAQAARDTIVSVSMRCAGGHGCLQRSIATALLCRLHGQWPTWCSGVRTNPFSAHAWVEIDGLAIGEPHPDGYYTPLLTVPARH